MKGKNEVRLELSRGVSLYAPLNEISPGEAGDTKIPQILLKNFQG